MIPYIDTSKPSKSREVTRNYLNKILKMHNQSIENISAGTLFGILQNYKTKQSKSSLSFGTIRYLFSTIAYYRNDLKHDPVFLNISKSIKLLTNANNNSNSTHTIGKYQEMWIRDTISYFVDIFSSIEYVNDVSFKILITKHKVKYYTGLAVILTLITNMRSSELQQITLNNLKQIMNNEDVSIKKKKKNIFNSSCQSLYVATNFAQLGTS